MRFIARCDVPLYGAEPVVGPETTDVDDLLADKKTDPLDTSFGGTGFLGADAVKLILNK